ncbi:MAG TPA: MBL fold metallo-hydrolase [Candidatus Ozemobacteraceae bacterium]|mgnify:CR=1 FL=1|nr:MBL fold metallo-hydrolase [Candidatus Ozemobacteraceae bacterium]
MKITFHGAAGCVTGSCYEVETGDVRFLVDCGMFQGSKTLRERNYGAFPFKPAEIDFVLVTHAHIDHTGLLPKLVKHGFSGTIWGTGPTVDLMAYMLPDSARIQESEVALKNRRNERKGLEELQPIYTEEDATATLKLMKSVKEGDQATPAPGITVLFRNAGHLLGSSFLDVRVQRDGIDKRIVFSGDLGSKDHPIIKDPEYASEMDFLLVESTYGNRVRPPDDKEARLNQLAKVVNDTVKRGGNLIIPAFAVERTQDLMHDLTILMENKKIPELQVTVDSPLASDSTKVFAKYPELYDEDATNLLKKRGKLFDASHFRFTRSAEESKALNNARGAIIMSSSGMCDAGRIKHHLKHQLWKPQNTVLFVGYQAEGTLGRLLLDGEKTVRIHGEEVAVKARIADMSGYSGHADQNGLLEWVSKISAVRDRVFVVHGEDDARTELAGKIRALKGFAVEVPALGQTFDLAALPPVEKAAPVVVPEAPKVDSYNVYAGLMLQLAEFMRTQTDEDKRRAVLLRIAETLKTTA